MPNVHKPSDTCFLKTMTNDVAYKTCVEAEKRQQFTVDTENLWKARSEVYRSKGILETKKRGTDRVTPSNENFVNDRNAQSCRLMEALLFQVFLHSLTLMRFLASLWLYVTFANIR